MRGFAWSFIVGGTVCAKNVLLRIVSELSVKRGEVRDLEWVETWEQMTQLCKTIKDKRSFFNLIVLSKSCDYWLLMTIDLEEIGNYEICRITQEWKSLRKRRYN